MSEQGTTLNSRIESCRGLLDVFQKERELLQTRQRIEPSSILHMLQLKLRLVDSVAECQGTMADANSPVAANAPDDGRQERLRELGALLEKLLVIERENQLLLRKLVASSGAAQPTSPPPSTAPEDAPTMLPLVNRLQRIRTANPRTPKAAETPRHAKR